MRYRFLRFPEGRTKALTLSYDDGLVHDMTLCRIAECHGLKVTLNIGFLPETEGGANMTPAQLRQTVAGGHEIALHGARHIAPGRVPLDVTLREFYECRRELERQFGGIVRGCAYPDSGITALSSGVALSEIKSVLRALGVAYARTLGGDNNRFAVPTDFWEWMPSVHNTNPDTMPYLEEFLARDVNALYCSEREPLLFYMWGHSGEFAGDWSQFEQFCARAGGHTDVWYATNIEICDYVNAFRSLQFNLESTLVHNPSALDVWFDGDGQTVCVPAGQTVTI